jgi:N-acetylneuraminic acid mutarotase
VTVGCSDNTYNIGVTVSGLTGSGLILQDNGGDNLSIAANGSVNFATPIASGSTYAVTVLSQPSGQTCTVSGGGGTVTSGNVSGIPIGCVDTYTIGGSVSGLGSGSLVLQDNGTDDLTISANGNFTFATSIAAGGAYAVTVVTQPQGQTCSVSNGSGSVGTANVTSVSLICGNVWDWIAGSNVINANAIYGTQGVASASNVPGARDGSISWTDSSGNLWLFGGLGFPSSGSNGYLSDLWQFTPSAGTWEWVSGPNTLSAIGVYGTQGVASTSNAPGGRDDAVSWTDASGNLWLFGGFGTDSVGNSGFLNDLWKFNPAAGTWEWVSGSTTINAIGNYGTQGVASASNVPGARQEAVSWTDASGNLWLFGGFGYPSSNSYGYLNDLWKFNPTAGTWEWVSGSSSSYTLGTYGTQGNASTTNVPGSRFVATSWIDASGNLWLFGGVEYSASDSGYLNDLWKFDPTAGTWEWVSGSNTAYAGGIYGTQGVASTTNVPGAREGAISWTDASGNLWLFGGDGFVSPSTGNLNDLWEFNPTAGTWEWVSGSNGLNDNGLYGTQGVPSTTNVPGGRLEPISWMDLSGNLWLFGGYGADSTGSTGYLNDLWEFTPLR